jgi:PIN domain nuclease of toxin-antitoxin system
MNYLLDTHVFLWVLSNPDRLNGKAIKAIQDPRHTVFVSAVSAVEIAIKSSLGKLKVPGDLRSEIFARGLQEIPLQYQHGERLSRLPMHHADPFDRMLIAQAMDEGLIFVTHDQKIQLYDGVKLLLT